MFRVVFFVDDKKLAGALHALTGIAQGEPSVQPVVNAEVRPNGSLAASTSGTLADMYIDYLLKKKQTSTDRKSAAQFLKAQGRSPASATYLLQMCMQHGTLTKSGGGAKTFYKVKVK
jgi:Secretory lipase